MAPSPDRLSIQSSNALQPGGCGENKVRRRKVPKRTVSITNIVGVGTGAWLYRNRALKSRSAGGGCHPCASYGKSPTRWTRWSESTSKSALSPPPVICSNIRTSNLSPETARYASFVKAPPLGCCCCDACSRENKRCDRGVLFKLHADDLPPAAKEIYPGAKIPKIKPIWRSWRRLRVTPGGTSTRAAQQQWSTCNRLNRNQRASARIASRNAQRVYITRACGNIFARCLDVGRK